MTRTLSALCVLTVALAGIAPAQTTSSVANSSQITPAQAKSLAKQANTPGQYRALASYYESQQKSYLAKAAEEKQEWARRSTNIVLTAAKYPRPVDSAHYLYDYYSYKAAEAAEFTTRFQQLAGPISPAPAN
jgi:hypothetical protein